MARRMSLSLVGLALLAACTTPAVTTTGTTGTVTHAPTGTASSPKVVHKQGELPDAPDALSTPQGQVGSPQADPLPATSAEATAGTSPGPSATATAATTSPKPSATATPTPKPSPSIVVKPSLMPTTPLPFALPVALPLVIPPTLAGSIKIVANNGGSLISEAGGAIISDNAGGILVAAPNGYHTLAGTYTLLGYTLQYLQIFYNTTGLVNLALQAASGRQIGEVVSSGGMTYALTLKGQDIVLSAYASDTVDPAKQLLAAVFSSPTKGYVIFRPGTVDPTNGTLVAHCDFDLATGTFDDYALTDASVVHPNGPGKRTQQFIRFVSPPQPLANNVVFQIATGTVTQDLATNAYTTLAVAANFPKDGGGAFLLSTQGGVNLPYYMGLGAQDADPFSAPASAKAVLPSASDYFQAPNAASPTIKPADDPIYQFPN
jgi:hypothetical protein